MQQCSGSVTFRTVAVPVDAAGQLGGTIEAASRSHRLYQARQPRTGDIDGRFWARGPGPLVAAAAVSEIRAIRVHDSPVVYTFDRCPWGIGYSKKSQGGQDLQARERPVCRALPIDHHVSGTAVQATVVRRRVTGGSLWKGRALSKNRSETRQCRKSICTTVGVRFAR